MRTDPLMVTHIVSDFSSIKKIEIEDDINEVKKVLDILC